MFEVTNQPPPLEPYSLLTSDTALREAVDREGGAWALPQLTALGATLGKPETVALGFAANKYPPELHAYDRFGHRIDEVDFHPAWHDLMTIAVGAGLHSSPWAVPQRGAHVARAAGTYMLTQIESGVYCPIAMTYGAVPTLRRNAAVARDWLPRVFGTQYDARFVPAEQKTTNLIGMAMTENQGGSDLRTNVSRATALPGDGERRAFRLTGHKWFMSAPMCDAFLVLAQAERGLSCFLLPRFAPDGERNAIRINRLKDKLGNRSNASTEVEFFDAYAELIGEEGRGIPTIIEMSNYTRLDCAIGSIDMSPDAPFIHGFNDPTNHERVIKATIDGIDACAAHGFKRVICFTGYSHGILDSQSVLAADVNLIEKPFTEKALLAKLREMISAGS